MSRKTTANPAAGQIQSGPDRKRLGDRRFPGADFFANATDLSLLFPHQLVASAYRFCFHLASINLIDWPMRRNVGWRAVASFSGATVRK